MGLQIVDRIADSTVKISNSRNGGSETWQSGVGSIRSGPLLTILWGSIVVEFPFWLFNCFRLHCSALKGITSSAGDYESVP